MAAEERNFRNQYYDKMGFRVVEEKKSLETMLSSDTIDVKKMRTFCLRFCLPIVTRPLVWKVRSSGCVSFLDASSHLY